MSQGEASDELRSLLSATRALLEFHRSTGAAGLPHEGPASWPPRVDDLLAFVPSPGPTPRPQDQAQHKEQGHEQVHGHDHEQAHDHNQGHEPALEPPPPAAAPLAAAPPAAALPAAVLPAAVLPTAALPTAVLPTAVLPAAAPPAAAPPAAAPEEPPQAAESAPAPPALTPEPPFGITALPPSTEPIYVEPVSVEPPAVDEPSAPLPPAAAPLPAAELPPAEPSAAGPLPAPGQATASGQEPEAHELHHETPQAKAQAAQRSLFDDEPTQGTLFGMADEPRRPRPLKNIPADLPPPRSEAALRRLDVLADKITTCQLCPLHAERKQTVFARGKPTADLCFIGEAPGADEDEQGLPFVGRAGQLLDRMIGAMGLQQDEVYVTNICRCRPPKNRTPTSEEMAACMPYLHEQMALVQPRVIVALGATATKGLLSSSLGIKAQRGTWKLYRGSVPVMPTYHPAYLLRETEAGNLDAKRDVWKDLQAVLERLGRPLPQRGKK